MCPGVRVHSVSVFSACAPTRVRRSKIAKELVGKLLADMSSMKIESELTAVEASEHEGEPGEGGLRGAGTEDTDPYSWMEDTMATGVCECVCVCVCVNERALMYSHDHRRVAFNVCSLRENE